MTDVQRPFDAEPPLPQGAGTLPAGRAASALGSTTDARRLIESYGMSHPGKVRTVNEDHFVTVALHRAVEVRQTNLDDPHIFDRLSGPRAYLYVVADGVGGSSGGSVASAMAVGTIVHYLGEVVGAYNGFDTDHAKDFPDHLQRAIQRAHDRLVDTFRLQGRGGPATTLTLAMIVWPHAYLVHVGDSRGYHLRGQTLRRLTRDQTVGDFLVTQHGMAKEKAEQAGLYNVLASAIGAADVTPAINVVPLERGDVLLLCTDGITKHVSDARIGDVLIESPESEAACRSLMELALDGGGSDNATAVVARILGG